MKFNVAIAPDRNASITCSSVTSSSVADDLDLRVVHDDVEPTEVLDRRLDARGDLVAVAHVAHDRRAPIRRAPRSPLAAATSFDSVRATIATAAPSAASAWAMPKPRP